MVKATFIISLVLTLTGFNGLCQMVSNDVSWISFYNECSTDFSKSFQQEMSIQLMEQFNAKMEIENCAIKNEFRLFVGFSELKTIQENGYSFSLIEVICRNNFSYKTTIYWKAADNISITQQDSVDRSDVEIGWCSDFDEVKFLNCSKDNLITEINGEKLQFKYAGNYGLFPDLIIKYTFKNDLTDLELESINELINSIYKEAYVSPIDRYEDIYYSGIDFQSYDFERGVKQMETFILELNRSSFVDKIESVVIR